MRDNTGAVMKTVFIIITSFVLFLMMPFVPCSASEPDNNSTNADDIGKAAAFFGGMANQSTDFRRRPPPIPYR